MTIVSAGPPLSNAVVSNGATLSVIDGGIVVAADVLSGGTETVSAGGTDSAGTVQVGGTFNVSSGTADSTTNAGGTMSFGSGAVASAITLVSGTATAMAGATVNFAVVSSGGSLNVAAGGTASATVVHSGGSLTNGGLAVSSLIEAGGSDVIYGGMFVANGLDSAATIASGGMQIVGGIAVSTTLQSGGFANVVSGGSALATMIDGGGGLAVSAGGTASGTTILSGGIEVVLAGGSAVGVTVDSGGVLAVLPGGSATGVTPVGAAIVPSVVLLSPQTVSAWTVPVSGVAVGSGGKLEVLSGGAASGVTITSSATETVASGGSDVGALISGSGYFTSLTIAGSGFGETVAGQGVIEIGSGGTIGNATVISGGALTIGQGGSASGTSIGSGGYVVAISGGVAAGTQVVEGGLYVSAGGSAVATTLGFMGVLAVNSGGSAGGVTLGGTFANMTVNSGGTASGITLSGNLTNLSIQAGATVTGAIDIAPQSFANISIFGSAMPSAVISGFGGADTIDLNNIAYDPAGSASYSAGTLTVSEGGQTYALALGPAADYAGGQFILTSDGYQGTNIAFIGTSSHLVATGKTSSLLALQGGDVLIVHSGGTNISATLSGTGPLITYAANAIDGGTLQLNSGAAALALEENAGTDSATQVGFGGNFINQGRVISATVSSGGLLFTAGGTAAGIVVASSGIVLELGSGTVASNTVVNGGIDGLANGGSTVGTVVNSGGEQVIGGKVGFGGAPLLLLGGTTSATTVNAGGRQFVNASGTASATAITAGGEMVVNSGGTADATRLDAAGTLVLNAGAVAGSGIVFAGGGALLDIGGTLPPATTISGFAATDTIDLTGIAAGAAPTATINAATDVLTISAGATAATLQLAGSYAGVAVLARSDGAAGTLLEIPCYAAGTRIATDRGEMPVEALAPGDLVRTLSGRLAPVRWVGRRRIDCRRHPRPEQVQPVRIRQAAFGPGQPHRDLLLSPDHAVLCGGVLIPVRCLVNGATIAPVAVAAIDYLHVELDRHDVLLAEGLPAESYLDTGNRGAFPGGGAALDLHPDFARRVWQAEGCAELVMAGARLAAARRRLLARAAALGHRITRDPALAVIADGRRLAADRRDGHWQMRLPAGVDRLELRSLVWIPAHTDPAADDPRRLGVAIRRLALDGRMVALDSPALTVGWHRAEAADWRWTDGAAAIPVAGIRVVTFEVPMTGRYWRRRPAAPGHRSVLAPQAA